MHLATGTSGKGLGAYPGLALVFHDFDPEPHAAIPSYLDLGHWAAHTSSPHTHSSNLVAALAAAIRQATPERMTRIGEHASWLRELLGAHDLALVAAGDHACPAGITFTCVGDAARLGEELERRGFALNFRSSHLRSRNWIQLSLLGDPPRPELERFAEALEAIHPAPVTAGLEL